MNYIVYTLAAIGGGTLLFVGSLVAVTWNEVRRADQELERRRNSK